MSALPTGTVTFVFTDIEESTRLLAELGTESYAAALKEHRDMLRNAFERHDGVELGTQGDSFFFAFGRASAALAAARDAQLGLASTRIRVRIGVHTGEPMIVGGEYVGMDVHKAARIAAAGHGGQVLASEQAAKLASIDGLVDLGLHRLKDLARAEPIYQLVTPDLPRDFPPLRTLDRHAHNLPLQTTPFIGRDEQIREVVARLASPGVRLLSLTGPAGTGKTRLSLAVAAELLESFPDGVFFVNLAPITDPCVVTSALAQVIGARDEAGRSALDVVRDHLQGKPTLLVLDNFEHLLPAAEVVGELIGSLPETQVLVTSRVPLRIQGEREYHVPPLGVPAAGSAPRLEHLARFEAIRLFLERAQAVRPEFQIDADNAGAVAEICRRLDGLPLAIELAAARVRILLPDAMLTRLTSRLKLLTTGPRDVPSRLQTLRGAIDWSHDLLSEEEKILFRRIGVFAGGATLEAIEGVCWGPELNFEILDGVSSLVEKSLLRDTAGPDGEPRIWMLETMNEYGREKLELSGERGAIEERHTRYFLELAGRASPHVGAAGQAQWLARLEQDHDNLRAVLRRSLDRGDSASAVRLAGALQTFWLAHGHLAEAMRWLNEVLSVPAAAPDQARARALNGAGAIARQQGDLITAERCIRESLSISRELGDGRATALALINLGAVFGERDQIEASEQVFEEARGLLRGLKEERFLAMVLTNLGVTAELRGDTSRAAALYEESLAISQRIGDLSGVSVTVGNLGHIAYDAGDYATAGERFRQSLVAARDSGHSLVAVNDLAHLAIVAAATGSPRRAARLFCAAEAHLRAIGAKQEGISREKYDRALQTARAGLSEIEWQTAWEEGSALPLDEAIDYALAWECSPAGEASDP